MQHLPSETLAVVFDYLEQDELIANVRPVNRLFAHQVLLKSTWFNRILTIDYNRHGGNATSFLSLCEPFQVQLMNLKHVQKLFDLSGTRSTLKHLTLKNVFNKGKVLSQILRGMSLLESLTIDGCVLQCMEPLEFLNEHLKPSSEDNVVLFEHLKILKVRDLKIMGLSTPVVETLLRNAPNVQEVVVHKDLNLNNPCLELMASLENLQCVDLHSVTEVSNGLIKLFQRRPLSCARFKIESAIELQLFKYLFDTSSDTLQELSIEMDPLNIAFEKYRTFPKLVNIKKLEMRYTDPEFVNSVLRDSVPSTITELCIQELDGAISSFHSVLACQFNQLARLELIRSCSFPEALVVLENNTNSVRHFTFRSKSMYNCTPDQISKFIQNAANVSHLCLESVNLYYANWLSAICFSLPNLVEIDCDSVVNEGGRRYAYYDERDTILERIRLKDQMNTQDVFTTIEYAPRLKEFMLVGTYDSENSWDVIARLTNNCPQLEQLHVNLQNDLIYRASSHHTMEHLPHLKVAKLGSLSGWTPKHVIQFWLCARRARTLDIDMRNVFISLDYSRLDLSEEIMNILASTGEPMTLSPKFMKLYLEILEKYDQLHSQNSL